MIRTPATILPRFRSRRATLLAVGLLLAGCTGTIGGSRTTAGGAGGVSGNAGGFSGSGTGSAVGTGGAGGNSGTGTGGGSSTVTPPPAGTDPGRVTMHRLNRVEYNNTVRDLLGTTLAPADDFPIDDRGSGFDNMADVLTLSPLHIASYDAAAIALLDEAFAVTAQRARLVPCDLTAQGTTCARSVLTAFAPLAWRRPVTTAEIDALMKLVTLATGQGDSVEVGLKLSLRAVLISANFLFRVETDPSPASATPHPLTPYELASRLSYFLWSSMPDGELFAAAKAATLGDATTLKAQIQRMLASPKAQALADNFAGQWLDIRGMADVTRDAKLFPTFDENLRAAMTLETAAMFKEVALNGLPFDKLLTADFTYLNDRLAKFYGLPAIGSAAPVKVSVAGTQRTAGLLSQGTFLTVTSHVDTTSPTLRGKWIMGQLLCRDVPPPPPNVNTMLDQTLTGTTLRERLEQHRTNPSCAVCHQYMDPLGLGLENYDAIGAYRATEAGQPIDSSGTLPGGATFTGARELAQLIAADPSFAQCVAQQVYTYALGRPPDLVTPNHMDPAVLFNLARSFRSKYDFKTLVEAIGSAPTFLNRRGEP